MPHVFLLSVDSQLLLRGASNKGQYISYTTDENDDNITMFNFSTVITTRTTIISPVINSFFFFLICK